jgi:hypothetical protein
LPSRRTPATASEFPAEPEVDDALAPLDSNPTTTYRFGFYKWPDESAPLVRFKTKTSPARRSGIGPAHSGIPRCGPASVRIQPDCIFLSPAVSKLVSDMIFKFKF